MSRLHDIQRDYERTLLVDDTDEDCTQLLSVICDGDPRHRRGFDVMPEACFQHDAYAQRGAE